MLSISTLLDDVMGHLGLVGSSGSTELSRATVLNMMNRTYWSILDIFPFREKEYSRTYSTVAGTESYAMLGSAEALQQIQIYNEDTERWNKLDRATIYDGEDDKPDPTLNVDERGIPERYYRRKNYTYLLPTPDAVYTIKEFYVALLVDLVDNSSTYPDMPRNFEDILILGTCYRGFLKLRDFVAAENYLRLYDKAVAEAIPTEAKEEFDSHTSHLEVLGRDYDYD